MKKNTFKFFTTKAKPYVRKIYKGQSQYQKEQAQSGFNFDFNIVIPRQTMEHIKKNRFKYELAGHSAGSAVAGYVGAKIANRKKRRKRK